MFENLSTAERGRLAKEKTECVVDNLLYLMELHETNAIVLYSPILSSQIPYSRAANAFNVFQRGLHQFEIVRLCALWDRAELPRQNIPTIIELVDDPNVIDTLARESLEPWIGPVCGIIRSPAEDPGLRALEEQALQQANEDFGHEQARKAREGLQKAIIDARDVLQSPRLTGIMNLRDKHLAHSLSHTRREQKTGPIPPMKYGDEREVLSQTLPIVEALFCWVNGKSLSFDDSRETDRRNAAALWTRCTFNVTD
jgi:hypothetical protein